MPRQTSRRATVLLDFDGVILRHPRAAELIRDRCERYVSGMTGCHPSSSAPRNLNRALYTTYGHTNYGLYRLGYSASLQRFNSYVYGGIDYDALFSDKEVVESHKTTMQDLDHLCEHHDTYIFSNAPTVWCSEVMKRIAASSSSRRAPTSEHQPRIHPGHVQEISPGLRVLQMPYLKPDIRAYEAVETMFSLSTGEKNKEIYFVEDSFLNLAQVIPRPRWRSMLLSDSYFALPNGLTLVDSLARVKTHVDVMGTPSSF